MTLAAVLTGDIIKSQKITAADYDSVIASLKQQVNSLQSYCNLAFTLYRGDEFQLYLSNPGYAGLAAVLIRLNLLSLNQDARISIGIGDIDALRDPVSTSTGSAFTLSGHGLQSMAQQRLLLQVDHAPLPPALALLIRFCDDKLQQLTRRQASALNYYLSEPNNQHQQIADRMRTSRVNVTKLLNQASYVLIEDFIRYLSEYLTEVTHG